MYAPILQSRGSNGYAVARHLSPSLVRVESLKPLGRETRKHPPAQVRKLKESLDRFGFVLPILVDGESRVVAGWGLVLAARKLGISDVPAVIVSDLSEANLRLLRMALNRLGEDFELGRRCVKTRVQRRGRDLEQYRSQHERL